MPIGSRQSATVRGSAPPTAIREMYETLGPNRVYTVSGVASADETEVFEMRRMREASALLRARDARDQLSRFGGRRVGGPDHVLVRADQDQPRPVLLAAVLVTV